MLTKKLKNLGVLNQKETAAYLAVLELGETTIQRIANKSKIKRTTLYDVIASLKEKGLVAITKKKKRSFYYAEDPYKIGEDLENKKKDYQKILPELLSLANLLDKKPKIKFFEGINGIKEVYKDTLKYANQETLTWSSVEVIKYFDTDWLWTFYVPTRIQKRIWNRTISTKNKYTEKLKESDIKSLRETKLVSAEQFPIEAEINLYGQRNIGIMAYKEQIGLIIESEKIYNTLKSIFEMNWGKF
jgi:sugar-specific transcriptional regulator TrmB